MKFALKTAVVLATLLASVAGQLNTVTFSNNTGSSAGAVYFMSNDPTGNYLFAANIGSDAKLTLAKGYATGGAGAHGLGNDNPLFSQNSIITSKTTNVVVVVNAGSNTLTAFQVNPSNPTELKVIGSPVPSGGEFPVSVAINQAGNMVCALNGGVFNGVSCFALDQQSGLTPINDTTRSLNLPQTTPATGLDNTAGQIIFTENDTKLLVSVKGIVEHPRVPGRPEPGFVGFWDINSDCSLSVGFKPTTGGLYTWGMTEIPGSNAILAGDATIGYDVFNLNAAAVDPAVRGQATFVQGQKNICCSGFSNGTGNFYLADSTSSSIYEVNVNDKLNGTLVKKYDLDRYDGPLDFSISNVRNKDRMYLLAANNTAVEVFNLDGPSELKRIQKLDVGASVTRAGLQFNRLNVVGLATYAV
ncbi:hypothetical protein AX15_002864 [Amanita polypyramis BW_CC]|nr:hypothetical protein AX15_002864 [Amanita polypyramis BW_CC]